MSEVLDQNEIDALLASVQSEVGGQAATATAAAAAPRPPRPEPQAYDFKRPERVSKDQIRAIASIHEVFARNFGASLSGVLRTIIDVRVVGVEQLTYHEFIHSLPNPTCFAILQAPPLEGQMCLELSPLIVYPLIDRLLGGPSNTANVYIPQRPLTSIEWQVVHRILERALTNLSGVWHNLVEAQFRVLDTETNPHLVHIVAPTEVVVFITFEIRLGQSAGTMCLCIPFNTIESILSRLTSQSWFYKPKPPSDVQRQRVERNLLRTAVGLTAFLGRTRIRLSELRGLRPGDVIPLEKRTSQDLLVQVRGRNKFAGQAGQLRGQRAIRVVRSAAPDEPL